MLLYHGLIFSYIFNPKSLMALQKEVLINIIRRKIAACSRYLEDDIARVRSPEFFRRKVDKMIPVVRIGWGQRTEDRGCHLSVGLYCWQGRGKSTKYIQIQTKTQSFNYYLMKVYIRHVSRFWIASHHIVEVGWGRTLLIINCWNRGWKYNLM